MQKNKVALAVKYVFLDYLSAMLAWTLFWFFRKLQVSAGFDNILADAINDTRFYQEIIIIPLFWLVIYIISGEYYHVFRKTRIQEASRTFLVTIIGVIILFFTLILNDEHKSIGTYYINFLFLFLAQIILTLIMRLILTSNTIRQIRSGQLTFNSLIIGSGNNAQQLYSSFLNKRITLAGNLFKGYITINENRKVSFPGSLQCLGRLNNLHNIIEFELIDELIIAIEPEEYNNFEKILSLVEDKDLLIKVTPDMKDMILGFVKTTSLFSAPLIQVSFDFMPYWQRCIKRVFDLTASVFACIILLPLFAVCSVGVMLSSPGPVLYFQERIGLKGRKFIIPKFRSMYKDAEKDGPQLSYVNDPRVTPFGRFLRKTRLDELPQFISVLKGDMSLVGPRPERQYYIDLITKEVPHYRMVLRVKPGITSWGQVKYGYAETVDQMVERLKYDILYLENMTLAMDFKIILYTLLTVLKGKGK